MSAPFNSSPETAVNTYLPSNQPMPSVAVLADGGFAVFWRHYATLPTGVYGQRYDANGNPAGAQITAAPSAASATGWTM